MFSPTYLFYLTQKFKKHSSFLRIKKISHNKLIIQNQRHKYLRGSIQRSFAYRTTRKIILPSIIQVVNQFDKMFKQIDGSIYRISRIPLHESNGPWWSFHSSSRRRTSDSSILARMEVNSIPGRIHFPPWRLFFPHHKIQISMSIDSRPLWGRSTIRSTILHLSNRTITSEI